MSKISDKLIVGFLVIGFMLSFVFVESVSGKITTIEFITGEAPRYSGVVTAMARDYEKLNPNVRIHVTAFPYDQYMIKVALDVASGGRTYDVIWIDYYALGGYADAGYLLPLDDLLTEHSKYWDDLKSDIYPTVLELYHYRDHQWAVPADANAQIFYYRQDILDQAGVEVPETSEEFLEVAAKIHNPPKVYATCFSAKSMDAHSSFLHPFFSLGGKIWDSQTFIPGYDTKAGQEALKWLVKVAEFAPPEIYNWGYYEWLEGMGTAGRGAMAPAMWGHTGLTFPSEVKLADKMGVTEVPSFDGNRVVPQGGFGVGINARIPKSKQNVAFDFIMYLTARENQRDYVRYGGQPARISALTDPVNVKGPHRYLPVLNKALAYAIPRPQIPEFATVQSAAGVEIEKALRKEQSINETLKNIQKMAYELLVETGRIKK